MALVQVCIYCHQPINPKDQHVEGRKEYQGVPRQLAHLKCYQDEMRKLK